MEEQFDIFDEVGNPLGVASRSSAHREGLWHRAANVFLFMPNGNLLIQRRQFDKDIWPGVWDLSAAEHLRVGETFEEGALRGLREELGVENVVLERLGDVNICRLDMPELGVKDYEFQQSFRCTFDGSFSPDPIEVHEIKIVSLEHLAAGFARHPNDYTPWFRQRMIDLKLFP